MAMISVPITRDISRLFTSLDVPGDRDPSDHITILHLGDNLKIGDIAKAMPLIYDVTSKMRPFLVTAKKITTFPKGDNGYPIIVTVEAPELYELRKKLSRVFDRRGIDYSSEYSEYRPHVTLGYNKKKFKNTTLPKKTQWQVNEICLYGGDAHDERVYVSFPLALGVEMKKSADYLLDLDSAFAKVSQVQIEQNLTPFLQQLLFNIGYFYQDPSQGSTNAQFANNIWIPALEAAQVYEGYNIDVTVPAGKLAVQFSGSPNKLVAYLNKNLAPTISSRLQRMKGRKLAEWTVAPPPAAVTFKYMQA